MHICQYFFRSRRSRMTQTPTAALTGPPLPFPSSPDAHPQTPHPCLLQTISTNGTPSSLLVLPPELARPFLLPPPLPPSIFSAHTVYSLLSSYRPCLRNPLPLPLPLQTTRHRRQARSQARRVRLKLPRGEGREGRYGHHRLCELEG